VYVTDWLCDYSAYTQMTGEIKMMVDYFNRKKPERLRGVWEDPNHPFSDYALLDPHYEKLSFQDVTMIGGWGGLGANPFPAFFKKTFADMLPNKFNGYMAYTEGIFDDFNEALTAQLAWNPEKTPEEFEREYCHYYFGGGIADAFVAMVRLMDDSWSGTRLRRAQNLRLTAGLPEAVQLESLTAAAAAKLPADVRASWRWQVFEQRAKLGLRATKLHDLAAFRAETERQLHDGTSKQMLRHRVAAKQAEVDAYIKEVQELGCKVYHEPPSRRPPMPARAGWDADATGVQLDQWIQTLENLRKTLVREKPSF
jgi:hypothetical protein